MNKIAIIFKREYFTRVRNKTFLLSTFLLPIILIIFIIGSTFIAIKSLSLDRIAVVNDPGFLKKSLKSDSSAVIFEFTSDVTSSNYKEKGYAGILKMNNDRAGSKYVVESEKNLNSRTMAYIEQQMNNAVETDMLERMSITRATLDSVNKISKTESEVSNELSSGEKANAGLSKIVGFMSGILIYITMFIFGAMVMRGVMEEKTNRIAEVMVSSVKPFQLMMGKILGIAAVGLTQLLLWIIFITVLVNIIPLFLPSDALEQFQRLQEAQQQQMPGGGNNSAAIAMLEVTDTLTNDVNWLTVISCFLFYFLGGYLFYASLFAAVGSVINEDPQEAQSLMLPITMPIIFGFIMLSPAIEQPDSSLAFWGSIIPFTSPIVMMGRIANGVPEAVPYWQLLLSMALLIGGFIFTTWAAGKIYRTGILLYGKKGSWKEMIKWIRRS